MALLSPMFERRAATYGLNSGDPALTEIFGGGSNGSNSAQNITAETATKISTVYACVNRKSNTLAMLPLNVMKRLPNGGKEIALNHRCHRQLHDRPNKWQTSFDWRKQMHSLKQLRGNAYSYISYHPGRGINELIPMDPERVFPFLIDKAGTINYVNENSASPSPGDTLWYQYFSSNGESLVMKDKEVLHFKGYSTNGIVGKTVIRLMRESIGLAMATEEQGARLFSNGAQIGKIFKHPKALSDITYNKLKKELNEATTGVSNSHKTFILEDGMEMIQSTLTMEDAQFLDTRKFQVEDIASFLDVPLILINRSGDKNQTFASAEQIISIFITQMMQPDFVSWEQTLNKDLLYESEKKDYYFNFDFDVLLRGDTKARAEYLDKRFSMGSMTPDDIRVYEGESPTGTEEGKKYYLKSGMMPIDMAGKQLNQPVFPTSVEKPKEVIE